MNEAIAAGVTEFGENYVQEARAKFARVALAREIRKHFIGHVQTNKAKAIVRAFDVVQSVDRPDAAQALSRAAEALGKTLPVLLQVNISPTERFGCPPAQAQQLAELIRSLPALALEGVMAIGPITGDRVGIARAFALAASVRSEVGGSTLSIGMTDDWPLAVEAGSTMIRAGTAIFGPRPARGTSKETVITPS